MKPIITLNKTRSLGQVLKLSRTVLPTEKINQAISWLHQTGGGTLLFSDGIYNARTIHLKSNVYLFINKGATIRAIKGADAPESTWFSDKKYRSGLSPTDDGPYAARKTT